MQLPCFFTHCTIRQRLILLNIITVMLITALVSIYSYQLISLENELVTMEQVDDLFKNILEVRRYEKNIMLDLDENSVPNAQDALKKIKLHFEKVSANIKSTAGKKLFIDLQETFNEYNTIFIRWCATDECTTGKTREISSRLVREQGHKLVDSATELVHFKRKNISHGFKGILFWLTFTPAIILIAGAILFFSQLRSILSRLSSLKQGTEHLAAGEFEVIPVTDSLGDEVSGLIDHFNEMVKALEQKQEQLIQSKKMASIGTFSSGIAHEINNPLNNISLSADILLEEFDSMDEDETKEILADIMTQTERASKIVRNLLDFSRVQSSEMQVMYIDFILHKTTDLIANELHVHKITLKKDIADQMHQINGDLHKLQQVFLNLIINAEQAIGDHGTITVRARELERGYIRTDIIDTGSGISQEYIDQVFDPFFTTKEAGKGTGLGLAIVYGIVKEHKGYIEVTSKIGVGTTFSVFLPIYAEDETRQEVAQ